LFSLACTGLDTLTGLRFWCLSGKMSWFVQWRAFNTQTLHFSQQPSRLLFYYLYKL